MGLVILMASYMGKINTSITSLISMLLIADDNVVIVNNHFYVNICGVGHTFHFFLCVVSLQNVGDHGPPLFAVLCKSY